jgi:hypothetical protein
MWVTFFPRWYILQLTDYEEACGLMLDAIRIAEDIITAVSYGL